MKKFFYEAVISAYKDFKTCLRLCSFVADSFSSENMCMKISKTNVAELSLGQSRIIPHAGAGA
jgi:hypothetical protein